MGVKSKITLKEVNFLFPSYNFTNLSPTSSGLIDTTYFIDTKTGSYILKKYERADAIRVEQSSKLLKDLKLLGLNVPLCLAQDSEWHLCERLKGSEVRVIRSHHMQALARFLSTFHSFSFKKSIHSRVFNQDEVETDLDYVKLNFYYYYKKLESLKSYKQKIDGIIHGDIFKDNVLFLNTKVGVFDFIDAADGSFYFECAVMLMAFDAKKHGDYFINIFLNTYNQHAPIKLKKIELLREMEVASKFYALKRVKHYKNTKRAKELL